MLKILNEYGPNRPNLLPQRGSRESPRNPLGRRLKAVTPVQIRSGLRFLAKAVAWQETPATRGFLHAREQVQRGFRRVCEFVRSGLESDSTVPRAPVQPSL